MQVFAEAGRAPQNPGPLIRVPVATTISVTVHSALHDSVLVLYGLHTRPGTTSDTIQIAPGATRTVSFLAEEPGTHFYWGSTTREPVEERNGIDSQLQGAFIIDAAGATAPDRVFVLGSWTGLEDSSGFAPDLRVINGLSWPNTERLSYTAGDTILWRWVNPTDSPHPMHGMRGMVMAVSVKPGVSSARRPETAAHVRNIRLIAKAAPRRFKGELDEMAFVRQDADSVAAADSVPIPSSLLVLQRNEPVRITIVNHLRAATAVHWHGIEVPAYSDGVPDWSASGSRVAPAIAPGDSFVAAFTPPRSGTFIYHAHSNEAFQINLGLYGGLIVVDSTYNAERDRLIILGSGGPNTRTARINGSLTPDTLRLKLGRAYRLRLIHIVPDWTTWIALLRGDTPEQWTPLAKDGAELPRNAQVMRQATLLAGPGETMDFEYVPKTPGLRRLEVEQRTGVWKTALPICVER